MAIFHMDFYLFYNPGAAIQDHTRYDCLNKMNQQSSLNFLLINHEENLKRRSL